MTKQPMASKGHLFQACSFQHEDPLSHAPGFAIHRMQIWEPIGVKMPTSVHTAHQHQTPKEFCAQTCLLILCELCPKCLDAELKVRSPTGFECSNLAPLTKILTQQAMVNNKLMTWAHGNVGNVTESALNHFWSCVSDCMWVESELRFWLVYRNTSFCPSQFVSCFFMLGEDCYFFWKCDCFLHVCCSTGKYIFPNVQIPAQSRPVKVQPSPSFKWWLQERFTQTSYKDQRNSDLQIPMCKHAL